MNYNVLTSSLSPQRKLSASAPEFSFASSSKSFAVDSNINKFAMLQNPFGEERDLSEYKMMTPTTNTQNLLYRVQFKHAFEDYSQFSGFIWSKGTYYPANSVPKPGDYVLVDRDRSTHVGTIVEVRTRDDFTTNYEERDRSPISLMENSEAMNLLDTLRQAENDSKIFCQEAVHLLGITIEEIIDVEIHADVKKVIIRYTKPLGVGHINFVDLIRYLRHNKFPGARIWLEDQSRKFMVQPPHIMHSSPPSKLTIQPSLYSNNSSPHSARFDHFQADSKILSNDNTFFSLEYSIYDPEVVRAAPKINMNTFISKKISSHDAFDIEEKENKLENTTNDFPVAKYPYYMCRGPGSNFSLFSS